MAWNKESGKNLQVKHGMNALYMCNECREKGKTTLVVHEEGLCWTCKKNKDKGAWFRDDRS